MSWLREYVLRLAAAGIICGSLSSLVSEKSTAGSILRVLLGIFLTLTVLQPLFQLDLSGLTGHWNQIYAEGIAAAEAGSIASEESIVGIIKQNTEAYILDKAKSLGIKTEVSVEVSGNVPEITRIVVRGNASPYARQRLTDLIRQELGITEEKQIWIG